MVLCVFIFYLKRDFDEEIYNTIKLCYNQKKKSGGDNLQFYNYIPIIFLFIVVFVILKRRKSVVAKKIIEKRNKGEKIEMIELAKRFIDKECIIYTFENHQLTGVIKEVTDGAVLVGKNGQLEAINLDFVLRIREYPVDKKGKKKSIILD